MSIVIRTLALVLSENGQLLKSSEQRSNLIWPVFLKNPSSCCIGNSLQNRGLGQGDERGSIIQTSFIILVIRT